MLMYVCIWVICCCVKGYAAIARVRVHIMCEWPQVCARVRARKGQRDTVLHITALQMAVVSGCDSESE